MARAEAAAKRFGLNRGQRFGLRHQAGDLVHLGRQQQRKLGPLAGPRPHQGIEGQRQAAQDFRVAMGARHLIRPCGIVLYDDALQRQKAIDPRGLKAGFGGDFARQAIERVRAV